MIVILVLGFERKARLFCDINQIHSLRESMCWDLSGRLGYFVTFQFKSIISPFFLLGFERKARLFCDTCDSGFVTTFACSWDLSGRLGYFVT